MQHVSSYDHSQMLRADPGWYKLDRLLLRLERPVLAFNPQPQECIRHLIGSEASQIMYTDKATEFDFDTQQKQSNYSTFYIKIMNQLVDLKFRPGLSLSEYGEQLANAVRRASRGIEHADRMESDHFVQEVSDLQNEEISKLEGEDNESVAVTTEEDTELAEDRNTAEYQESHQDSDSEAINTEIIESDDFHKSAVSRIENQEADESEGYDRPCLSPTKRKADVNDSLEEEVPSKNTEVKYIVIKKATKVLKDTNSPLQISRVTSQMAVRLHSYPDPRI